MFKLMGKKIIKILRNENFLILDLRIKENSNRKIHEAVPEMLVFIAYA